MFLPDQRRLLQVDRNYGYNNSISGNINSSNGTPEDIFMFNSSSNASGIGMVDLGEGDLGYSDMQTVFLACIATLIPLVFSLVAAIGVRFLWRRYHTRKCEGYEGVLQREESSDPLAVKSLSASGNLLTDELKTSESQFSVTPAEEIEDVTSQSPLLSYGASSGSLPNHTSKSANGSIITMTMKNNHLIVETEERGGMTLENGAMKTTTTKFTTSASPHENNVFVVEVQQGGPVRSTTNTEVYPKLSTATISAHEDAGEETASQRAQVHRPPDIDVDEVSEEDDLEDIEDGEDEDEDDVTEHNVNCNKVKEESKDGSTNTGLSQSDLSISSSGSNNPSYRYGNQLGYEGGHFGYPQYVGYTASDEKVVRTGSCYTVPGKDLPSTKSIPASSIVMKRASSVTEATEKINNIKARGGRYSIDVTPVSSRLLSDIQAIERRCQQEDERLQEEQRQLGNGTAPVPVTNGDNTSSPDDKQDDIPTLQRTGSLPCKLKDQKPSVEENNDNDVVNSNLEAEGENTSFETNKESVDEDSVSSARKRGSLPIIKPELYTQIKQTTKSLILDKTPRPGLSPKFEKFRNENSPLNETDKDSKQLGDSGSTKEYENKAFIPSDQIPS